MDNSRIKYQIDIDLADFRRKVANAWRILGDLERRAINVPVVPTGGGGHNTPMVTGSQAVEPMAQPPVHSGVNIPIPIAVRTQGSQQRPPSMYIKQPGQVMVPGGHLPYNFITPAPRHVPGFDRGRYDEDVKYPPGTPFAGRHGIPAGIIRRPRTGSASGGPILDWPEGSNPPALSFMPRSVGVHVASPPDLDIRRPGRAPAQALGGRSVAVTKTEYPGTDFTQLPGIGANRDISDILGRIRDNTKSSAEQTKRLNQMPIVPGRRPGGDITDAMRRMVGEAPMPAKPSTLRSAVDPDYGDFIRGVSAGVAQRRGTPLAPDEILPAAPSFDNFIRGSKYEYIPSAARAAASPYDAAILSRRAYKMTSGLNVSGERRPIGIPSVTGLPATETAPKLSYSDLRKPGLKYPASMPYYAGALSDFKASFKDDLLRSDQLSERDVARMGKRLSLSKRAALEASQAVSRSNVASTSGIGSGISRLGAGAASFMTAQRSMPNLFTLRNMIGGYAGAKLIGNISESGEKIEYLRRMYEVFYGDAKRGAKELEQTLELARLSPFDALEIADQRRLLRAFGIDSQRILTNITNTAAATDKPLQQITISLGRLASGVYGEGFEGLRRIGISQRELFEEGLEFNPRSQQFMGTPEQAINAVMRIMERRFPAMAESMMTTWKGQKENLHDAWVQAIAPLGELMHRVLMRPMEAFSQNLVELRDGFITGSKALGTFLSDLEKLLKLPSAHKIDSITGTDEIDKLMGNDPSDMLTKLETQRGMWESPPELFEEGSVMDSLGNASKEALAGTIAIGAGLAMQMSGKSWEEQGRAAAGVEQASIEFMFQGKSTQWLIDKKARMDKAAARAKSGDVPKPIKMWGLEMPVPDTGGEWTDQTNSPKYKAIEKMLKEREEFNKRLEALRPELQSKEREALAEEVKSGVDSRKASRRVLKTSDIKRLEKFDKEIARREANLEGLQESISEYDIRAGIFAGGGEWEWGRDQIEKQQAELAELKRRRQIIESRIKSPVAYDQYLRTERERTAQKNIEKDNRASERYSERESINVSNSQNNYTYIYGQSGGTLTGAAGSYGGAR